ncbi:MAG: outer membrane beta-barrel protein, partial [Caulobacteraceae bacterium]
MKTTLLAGAALAAVLAATGGAQAQPFDFLNMGATTAPPPNGFYLGVDGGWHELNNGGIGTSSSNNAPDGSPYGWKFSPSKGGSWAAFGRVGYQFTPNWRVELEGGYRDSDLRRVIGSADRAQPIGICGVGSTSSCLKTYGNANVITVMGNAIYDAFPTWIVHPFVGAGVGIARLDIKDFGQFSGGAPGQTLSINDTDTAFAYQAFAGLSYHATHRLNVDLKYTWLDTGADMKWGSTGSGAIQPGTFRGHYNDSAVTIGLRYALGSE